MIFLYFIISLISAADPNVPFALTVGNVDIWRIQDSSRTSALSNMFPTLSPSNFIGLVDSTGNPYLTSNGNFVDLVSYSGTLLHSQGKWILVDDGLGSLVPSTQPTRIPQGIETIIPLTEINFVLLTHFHTDHTGWNVNAPQNTIEFPNAQYIAQSDEISYWSSSPALRNSSNYQNLIQPVITAGLLQGVTGTHAITDEVSVIPCKGHTPGHQCVQILSAGKSAIIIGDSMHRSFQVQRPDWSAVYDWNTSFSEPLRKSLVTMIGENSTTMMASHFLFPGVGHIVKETNPLPTSSGWIFVPVSSQ
jgi:glyoxylase-like metal-dependent hydrolase (beta-lactamase superfamily II)